MPGPVGKRSDAKHGHRTKAEKDNVAKAEAGTPIRWTQPDPQWHKIAKDWYLSLRKSGQHRFFEQSDVATAYYVAEAMSRNLKDGKFSGVLFASVMSAMTDLLTTEGARRRARVELQREEAEDENTAELTILDDYRKALE